MKYLNTLLVALILLLSGCTYLDVVPKGDIENVESIFEKRKSAKNWFKVYH